MTLRYYYMDPDANAVELTDRIWTALEWHSSAEELNAVQSEWVIEDPDSDLLLYPWRRVYVLDDDAPTDHQVIGMGSICDIHIRRSEVYPRTPTCRAWHLIITDLNYEPHRWLFEAADSPDRSAETDLARVAWYLGTDEAALLASGTDCIDASGGVNLDAIDLTTQSPADMLRGAMDQSGRNAFVLYDESKGPPDFDVPEDGELQLFYAHPSSDFWASTLTLSNDPADIDPSNGVYPLAEDDLDLHLDPTRINYRLHVSYDGGLVSVQDASIAATYGRRETTLDAPDLTDATKATARGNRMLQESSVPENRIEWGYHCQSGDVNSLLAGQSFQYRATHLGGLTDLGVPDYTTANGVRVRSMDRTVIEKSQGNYYVSGTAVPIPVPEAVTIDCENDLNEPYGTVTDGGTTIGYGPVANPGNVNDGDDNTASGHNTGIVGANGQFVRWKSDLGSARSVVGFVTLTDWGCGENPENYATFQFSDNGTDWTACDVTVASSSYNPGGGGWTTAWEIDAGSISHRYWRLTFVLNTGGFHCLGFLNTWCIVGPDA
jgi:hypothetical protein